MLLHILAIASEVQHQWGYVPDVFFWGTMRLEDLEDMEIQKVKKKAGVLRLLMANDVLQGSVSGGGRAKMECLASEVP